MVGLRLDGSQLHVAVEEVQRRTTFFEEVFDVTVVVTVAPAEVTP